MRKIIEVLTSDLLAWIFGVGSVAIALVSMAGMVMMYNNIFDMFGQ